MKFKKWFSATAASILLAASLSTATAKAEEQRTIADESIYDVLVDRFFNGEASNDIEVNTQNQANYAGGDFTGLIAKKDFIIQMGFTLVSIGSIFEADDYAGKHVKSYTAVEEHFGTNEQLIEVIEAYKASDVGIVIDFPLSNVAAMHEWATANPSWVAKEANGVIQWDMQNVSFQQQLLETIKQFVERYEVSGLRLTNLNEADDSFLNAIIDTVKSVKPSIYVMTNEESDANFDLDYYDDINIAYRDMLKNVDMPTSALTKHIEASDKPVQIMFDELTTDRFTYNVTEQNMFPPTRMKIALATVLLMPGVPVIQYGSEIVMNGTAGKEAHQIYNFKTETEIIDYIKNLQQLRNESTTLRTGEWKLLENENGFITLKRKSAEETWFIVINNTSKTKNIRVPINEVGVNKELRGLFDNEVIRENKNAEYAITLDRERVEVFQVIEKRGINISYIIALALVFIGYIAFIFAMMKRSKKRKGQVV